MNKKRINLHNKTNELLVGDWFFSDKKVDEVVILIHEYNTSRIYSTADFAQAFIEKEIPCIFFDLSGCGESEGEYAQKTISDWVEDCLCVYAFAQEKGYEKISLVASSLGCSSALSLALRKEVKKMCLLSPGIDYYNKQISKHGKEHILEWEKRGFREIITDKGDVWRSNFSFIEDARKYNFENKVSSLLTPTLFVYGTNDKDTLFTSCEKLVNEMPNAQLLILEGADHALKINDERTIAKNSMMEWFLDE